MNPTLTGGREEAKLPFPLVKVGSWYQEGTCCCVVLWGQGSRARETNKHNQPTKIINYRSIIRWCLNEKVVSWGSERRARDLNQEPTYNYFYWTIHNSGRNPTLTFMMVPRSNE